MISVLTVNYHSSQDLASLAESLRARDCDEELELIVTNNSSGDRVTLQGDERLRVQIIESMNVGYAAGINKAYRESRGETIMVANPDLQLLPPTLKSAIAALRTHSDAGIILPRLRYPDGTVQQSVRRFYTLPVVIYARLPLRNIGYRPRFFRNYLCEGLPESEPLEVDWGLGAAMFLRRQDLSVDWIFDERFFLYFEDVDLCFRTWQFGRKVLYCPEVECIHAHRRDSGNPFSGAGLRHFKSLLTFVWKYGGLPRRPGGLNRAS